MKIRSIILFSAITTLGISSVRAQSPLRIQAGLNLANVSVTSNGHVNDANTLTSFQAGIVADAHLGSVVYFQPGILYTGKGFKAQSGDQNSGTYAKATTNPF